MSDSQREPAETQDGSGPPGVPAWLKISGAIVAVLAVVILVILLVGGGEHGPGRHGAEGMGNPDATRMATTSAGAPG